MSEFKVEIQQYNQLTQDEQAYASENGSGKEYASYLRIIHNGKSVLLESDAMEPEDCRFYRDLGWVAKAIRDAYELGKSDASK